MKHIKLNIILLAVCSLVCASCGDFLNESPRHKWDVGQAMTTYSNAVQAVNGIYAQFMPGDAVNMDLMVSYLTKSGLVKVSGDYDWGFTYTQSTSSSDVWTTCYKAINACNLAINGIPKVPAASFPTAKAANELMGEARFLRGYLYSMLMLNYSCWYDSDDSKYGLVYRDQTSDATNYNVPRITVGESWTKIMEDIDFGIANMPASFTTPRTASQYFAKAYKAKLLLIRGAQRNSDKDIQEAKTLIDDCLSNIPSGVSMRADMAEHFSLSWDSSENIFVRYLEDNASRTSNAGYWCTYGPGYNLSTNCIINGVDIPQSEATCGLEYGIDWMRADPRWYITTGRARHPETWDDTYAWTIKKIYREGQYLGKQSPIDEKYAVYLMRLPELYIMQAELRARTGASLAESIAPINTMRAKRTNPVLDPIPTPANEQDLWDAIFQEYVKELIYENGCEFYASLRIKKNGVTYMEEMKGSNFHYDQSKLQYPIPEQEMQNNSALAGMQNPGQE